MYICWIQSTCVKKGARNSSLRDALPQCGRPWRHRGRLLKYFSISNSLLKTLSDQLESELLISQEQNKPAIIVICYDIVRYDRTLICYDIVRKSLFVICYDRTLIFYEYDTKVICLRTVICYTIAVTIVVLCSISSSSISSLEFDGLQWGEGRPLRAFHNVRSLALFSLAKACTHYTNDNKPTDMSCIQAWCRFYAPGPSGDRFIVRLMLMFGFLRLSLHFFPATISNALTTQHESIIVTERFVWLISAL